VLSLDRTTSITKELVMATYAIDSGRTTLVGTGIVEPVMDWTETADGSRRPSEHQARDEATGMPLWGVEVLHQQTSWGRASTVTARVTVGAPAQPVVGQFAPVGFRGLTVDVRVNRKSGALTETWRAEEITAPTSAEAGSAGAGPASGAGSRRAAA
jgi:hypothetical protein